MSSQVINGRIREARCLLIEKLIKTVVTLPLNTLYAWWLILSRGDVADLPRLFHLGEYETLRRLGLVKSRQQR